MENIYVVITSKKAILINLPQELKIIPISVLEEIKEGLCKRFSGCQINSKLVIDMTHIVQQEVVRFFANGRIVQLGNEWVWKEEPPNLELRWTRLDRMKI